MHYPKITHLSVKFANCFCLSSRANTIIKDCQRLAHSNSHLLDCWRSCTKQYKDSFLIQSTDATKMARKVQRYRRFKHLFILVHTKLTMEETCRPTIREKQKHWSLLAARNHGFFLRECVDLLLEEGNKINIPSSQLPDSMSILCSQDSGPRWWLSHLVSRELKLQQTPLQEEGQITTLNPQIKEANFRTILASEFPRP